MNVLATEELETEIRPGFSPSPVAEPEINAVQESPSGSGGSDSPLPSTPKPPKKSSAKNGPDLRRKSEVFVSAQGMDHQVQGGIVTFQ